MAQIKKLDDGKYLIRVSKGTGKGRTFINKVFRGTKAKAKEHARDLETQLDSGQLPTSRLNFTDFTAVWLDAIAATVAPRTLDGYREYIKRYAETRIGKVRLSEIRTFHLQSMYGEIGKSPTTVRNLHAALRACFGWAVKKDYIRANPCRNIDLPARENRPIVVLSAPEAAVFISHARKMPLGVMFELALMTGMRPEEYLALRWTDITGTEISVSQAVQFNRKGGGFYFKELKTARSRRRVSISESLAKQLVRHRVEQNKHRLAMKGTWYDHGLVFPNEIGRPHQLTNITRRFLKPILDLCKFPNHLTLYSLRHSCATLLLMQGVNPKVVADRLGHSSVVLTLDTYSHVLPHMQDAATDLLDRVMRGSK